MRSLSKVVLLAMMAIAAMAATAPSAFAQSETEPLTLAPHDLEVRSEPTGVLCPAVLPLTPPATGEFTTSGGCFVHAGGNAVLIIFHLFGIEEIDTVCDVEFDLRVASNATGYLTHQELSGGSCTRRACHYPNIPLFSFEPPSTRNGAHNEAKPWRTYAEERTGSIKELRVLFCIERRHDQTLEPTNGKQHCNYHVRFTETPANHRYTVPLTEPNGIGSGSPRCELQGEFTTEAVQVAGPGTTESTRMHVEINHI